MPQEEKGTLDGFWVFFNEIMQGRLIEKTTRCGYSSEGFITQIQEKLLDITRNFTTKINQNVYSNSEIVIKCGGEDTYLKDHQLLQRKQEYDSTTGDLVKGSGCFTYGCCFNVTQGTKVKLHAINNVSTDDVNKIENVISTAITQRMDISGNKCPINSVKKVTNKLTLQTENRETIREIIRKSKFSEVNIGQKIEIEYSEPLFCVNRCNETPSAGEIKQISNIDIMTRNMIISVVKNIERNTRKAEIDSDMTIDNTDEPKIKTFVWSAYSALIVVLAYYFCEWLARKIISIIAFKFIIIMNKLLDSPVGVLITAPIAGFLLWIMWRLWKFGWCWNTTEGGIMRKLLCFWPPLYKFISIIICPICNWIAEIPAIDVSCGSDIKEFCKCADADCKPQKVKCA